MELEFSHAASTLRSSGHRVTSQKEAVIRYLEGNTSHPTAEEVALALHGKHPTISLSTIYKTLNELADLGLIQRLDSMGSLRFDPSHHDHGHLVCKNCGVVVDIPLDSRDYSPLLSAARASAGEVDAITVTYHGLCCDCLAEQSSPQNVY